MTTYTIIVGILSLITMIVFFVMASRIGTIAKAAKYYMESSTADPDNYNKLKCENCGKEFTALKTAKYPMCPGCNAIKVKVLEE